MIIFYGRANTGALSATSTDEGSRSAAEHYNYDGGRIEMKVKSTVKAGKLASNHNQKVTRRAK